MPQVTVDWDGDRINTEVDAATYKGLLLSAEALLGASDALVPIEEGTLSRSGVARADRSRLTAGVGYDTVYAARQHEELTWRHAPGRTAKYLETPWIGMRKVYPRLIQAQIRSVIGP